MALSHRGARPVPSPRPRRLRPLAPASGRAARHDAASGLGHVARRQRRERLSGTSIELSSSDGSRERPRQSPALSTAGTLSITGADTGSDRVGRFARSGDDLSALPERSSARPSRGAVGRGFSSAFHRPGARRRADRGRVRARRCGSPAFRFCSFPIRSVCGPTRPAPSNRRTRRRPTPRASTSSPGCRSTAATRCTPSTTETATPTWTGSWRWSPDMGWSCG